MEMIAVLNQQLFLATTLLPVPSITLSALVALRELTKAASCPIAHCDTDAFRDEHVVHCIPHYVMHPHMN
jgi:hypothetical protein